MLEMDQRSQLQTLVFMTYVSTAHCVPSKPPFPHVETIIRRESSLWLRKTMYVKYPRMAGWSCDKAVVQANVNLGRLHTKKKTASKML